MNRRQFFASSTAAAVAAAAATSASALVPATAMSGAPLYKFIYDGRYPAARAFGVAAESAHSTAGTAAINGDVTALWARDLRGRWSAGSGAIAGMTTARTLFCLQELAKDHWMRVVIRVDHAISERRGIAHASTVPEAMVARMRFALRATDWPARMPAELAACRGWERAPRTRTVVASAVEHGWAPPDCAMLVSFVIA